jgi:hypothetical protein
MVSFSMPDPLNSKVEVAAQLLQLLGEVVSSPLVEKHIQVSAWLFSLIVKPVPILLDQVALPPFEEQWALVTVPLASRTSTLPLVTHTEVTALVSEILLPLRIAVDFARLIA